jgi:hypothetical protein
MPRIVSGADEFNPDAALLRGTAIGREWGRARDDRAEEERKNMLALLEFHQEATKVKKAEADAWEKHAQGKKDAKALATHAAFLERQKENPRFRAVVERKGLVEKSLKGMAARGVSEDTIQRVIQHVKGAEASLRKEEESQQFEEFLQRMEGHAGMKPEDVEGARQQAMMGGNRASIAQGLSEKKTKFDADETFKKQNAIGAQRAAALVESMPPGTLQHAQALGRLTEFEHDAKAQATSGAGERLYQEILGIAGGKTDEEYQTFKKAQAEALGAQQAPGLGGMTIGEMQHEVGKTPHGRGLWGENVPQVPPLDAEYQSYAKGLQAEKERRYPGRVGKGDMGAATGYSIAFQDGAGGASDMPQQPLTGADVVAQVQAAGGDITDPEVLAAILAQIEGGGGAPPGR